MAEKTAVAERPLAQMRTAEREHREKSATSFYFLVASKVLTLPSP